MRKNAKWPVRAVVLATAYLSAHAALAAGPDADSAIPAPATSPIVTAPAAAPTLSPPTAATLQDAALAVATPPAGDAREVECVAKVIRHEAANQPELGQMAVAQVILARMTDGRFPTTACGVVRQRGQFFDVDAYDPPRGDARWATARRIAAAAMRGEGDTVADGALFFHSAGATMPGRVRVTQIADHTFYR